jgi:Fuc2NAc and GlcNAc transferase
MPTLGLIAAGLAATVSFVVAWFVMRRAGRLGLMQEVNARSSHTRPTPGGGGVGIVAGGTIAGLLTALLLPFLGVPVLMASILIAFIGYYDDRRPIAVRWRLGAQVLLMGAVVAVLPLDAMSAGLGVPESVLMVIFALAGALWINLFNFMDGIDGLAASEAVFVLAGAALVAFLFEPGVAGDPRLWWMLGLAAACLGFLLLNWPPARIFMGDAGSTYLGLMTAFFALTTGASYWLSVWQWLILGALFLADSLATLARRIIGRERFWEGHKRHAYQALSRRWGSHLKVTLAFIAIDVIVLLPLAVLAGAWRDWGFAIAALVFAVLVPLALWAGAGATLEQDAEKEGAGSQDGE